MVKQTEKQRFSERLNLALDEVGAPAAHGRQAYCAKLFGLSQVGVRKWLLGESMPLPSKIKFIVSKINSRKPSLLPLREEWLLFGHGPMRAGSGQYPSTSDEGDLIDLFRSANDRGREDILAYAQLTAKRYPRVKDDLFPMNITGSHSMSPEAVKEMHRVLNDPAEPKYNFTDNANKTDPRGASRSKRRRAA